MARANRLSEQVPMKVALKEVMPTKFLPYARHVSDDVVMLDSGAIMLTFELQGRAFETADVRDLNDWHAKLNGMLRNLHDDRLSIWTHLVRARVEHYPGGNFRSRFARDLDAAYFARMNKERLFINRFFVTLVLRPRSTGPTSSSSSSRTKRGHRARPMRSTPICWRRWRTRRAISRS